LLTHWNSNIEVIEFESGKIKFYDRSHDKEFVAKLRAFLESKTGIAWSVESIEKPAEVSTANEEKDAELKADPMVADALELFGGAEVLK
jgi:hypothetical protein